MRPGDLNAGSQVHKSWSWISGIPKPPGRTWAWDPHPHHHVISLRMFAEWSGILLSSHPAHMSCAVSSVGWWETPGAAHPMLLAAGAGRHEGVKGDELSCGQLQRCQVAHTSLVEPGCSEVQLWEVLSLTVDSGARKINIVNNVSGACKLLLLRITESSK